MRFLPKTTLIVFFASLFLLAGDIKPSWVKTRPHSKEHYIGIAFASKSQYPQKYRQIAKDEALRDLASEIQVNISAEFLHRIAEQGGMLEDEMRSLVKSKTQANLKGYDLVDSWEDKARYWVYYRLSKKEYTRRYKERKKKITALARDLYFKAKKSEHLKDISSALRYSVQALAVLDEFLGEPLQISYKGQNLYLQNELYASIQSNFSCLKLKPAKPIIKAKKGFGLHQPLRVKISCTASGNKFPVSGLPVRFSFVKGGGQLVSRAVSDENGVAVCPVSQISSSEKTQIIRVEINTRELFQGKQIPLKNLTIPESRFILKISAITAYMEASEENMGEKLKVRLIAPKLKKALSAKGFSFTDDVSEADYLIKINAQTREALSMLGTTMVKADVTVSVTSLRTGEDIYENGFTTFPGMGFKSDQAGSASLEFAARKMEGIAEEIVAKTVK